MEVGSQRPVVEQQRFCEKRLDIKIRQIKTDRRRASLHLTPRTAPFKEHRPTPLIDQNNERQTIEILSRYRTDESL